MKLQTATKWMWLASLSGLSRRGAAPSVNKKDSFEGNKHWFLLSGDGKLMKTHFIIFYFCHMLQINTPKSYTLSDKGTLSLWCPQVSKEPCKHGPSWSCLRRLPANLEMGKELHVQMFSKTLISWTSMQETGLSLLSHQKEESSP